MKLRLLALLFVTTSLFAQHTITYNFLVEDCNSGENISISKGSFLEGENMVFEDYTFPEGNSNNQFFYNLIVGGELGFPMGSLKENISCDIILSGLCDLDLSDLTSKDSLLELTYLDISVTGEKSGLYVGSNYYFLENGKESYFKIPLAKIRNFLSLISYSLEDFTPYYIDSESKPDYVGIRKETEEEFLSIYSKHFSSIGFGFTVHDPSDVNDKNITTNAYKLNQNYPNPFNPTTIISYTLPQNGFVKLSVFNVIGEEIENLVNEHQSAGNYSINFNASNLPSGLYFYKISSNNFTKTNKMILSK